MALRLQARLTKPADVELVDAPLPPVKGFVDERHLKSKDCFTPAGLPIRFYAHFRGDFSDIVVVTAETVLLRLGTHVNCHAELRLPTEELLQVAVVNY